MIASNYRRHPDAMALQLVLAFVRCTWHTERPTTSSGPATRAERTHLATLKTAAPLHLAWDETLNNDMSSRTSNQPVNNL